MPWSLPSPRTSHVFVYCWFAASVEELQFVIARMLGVSAFFSRCVCVCLSVCVALCFSFFAVSYDLRRALLPLLPVTNPVRTLHVTREANGGLGYLWRITFTTLPSGSAGYTTAAYGDVPALVPSKTLLTASNGGTLDVLNMATGATGSRPNGVILASGAAVVDILWFSPKCPCNDGLPCVYLRELF